MDQLWSHIHEVIALVIVLGCFVTLAFTWHTEIAAILGIAAGWAFGRATQQTSS